MKTVLITGGARSLGATLALMFAQNNYNVIINYHKSKKEALALEQKIKETYKVKTMCIQADISQEEEVIKMLEQIKKENLKIDVLINNAVISKDEELMNKDIQEFREVINVNLVGTFIVSKLVAQMMLEQKSGCIINIASTNGIDTYNTYSADYDASKAGIISLTHNLAKALAPYIRVNAIAPGWIKTPSVLEMNPQIIKEEKEKILLKRFANPEEIGEVALFLASDKASYVNNSIIRVDGGVKC